MILTLNNLSTGKALPLFTLLTAFIYNVKSQKYWSCDEECPLKCSGEDHGLGPQLCCYIPDVTVLAITFSSKCHFDCANKCYSHGLKVNNEGDCLGLRSSESESVEGDDEEADEDIANANEHDVFETASELDEKKSVSVDSLERVYRKNDPDRFHGRQLEDFQKKDKKIAKKNETVDLWGSDGTDDNSISDEEEDDNDKKEDKINQRKSRKTLGRMKQVDSANVLENTEKEEISDVVTTTSSGNELIEQTSYEPVYQNFEATESELGIPYMKDWYPSTTFVPNSISANE